MIDYKLIGKRIKDKRIDKNLTQEKLAESLGVSNEYMSKIENAKIEINLKRLAELSVLLETPIEYFISGAVMKAPEYKANEFVKVFDGLLPKEKNVLYNIAEQIKSLRQ